MGILVCAVLFYPVQMGVLCSFLFPQANEVLHSFLQSQSAIEKSILQSDKALSDVEKAMAGVGQGWAHHGRLGSRSAI